MIRQALHGYEQGHRLLAASEGVTAAERDLLDRLSDLPGYLPLGYRFARYLTGFPCGDGCALACTWPDPSAPRGGAVYTHTLLLDAAALDAPFAALTALFRRPTRGDYRGHAAVLPIPTESGSGEPTELPPELVAAFFGASTRPLCRVGVSDAEAMVAALWGRLWPEARRALAFCTSAFAPITLPDRPFDLLFLPPESRGAFHRVRADAAWLEGPFEPPPWLPRLLAPETIPAWITRCRELGLPLPAPPQVWLLARLDELEAPAKERLTAARARADQLARLWPDATAARGCWRSALTDLLMAQVQAPTSPRPYWELADLLDRPQVAALGAELPELAGTVRDQIARRFLEAAPPETLVARGRALGIEAAVLAGAADAVRSAPDRADIARLLQRSMDASALFGAVLGAIPASERVAACGPRLGEDAVVAAARNLGDATLLAAARSRRGEPALAEAMPLANPAERAAILAEADREEALAWALEHAALLSASEIGQLGWEIEEVAPRCAASAQGVELLLVLAERAGRTRTRTVLARLPALAERLLLERPQVSLILDAAESLPPERVLALLAPQHAPSALIPSLVAPLLRALLSEPGVPGVGGWLADPRITNALNLLSPWQIRDAAGRDGLGSALPRLLARAGASVAGLTPLLLACLRAADRNALDAATDDLLALPDWPLMVASEVLGAVRRTRTPLGAPLVARAFVPVYQDAARSGAGLGGSSWWYELWWDRAKEWRHWLAETWIARGWPPEILAGILAQDPDLDRKVQKRLASDRHGNSLLLHLTDPSRP